MKLLITFLVLVFNGVSNLNAGKVHNFIAVITIDKCEGKYNYNFTIIETGSGEDGKCQETLQVSPITQIIQCGPNGERTVSTATRLAATNFPNGATYIYTPLNLGVSGPLQGVYMFNRHEYTSLDYLKICSSSLGRGAIGRIDIEIVFTDKLNLNVFLSNNPYEASKKGANTICTGTAYIV